MDEGVKEYKTYAEQMERHESRGMDTLDSDFAISTLRRVNYYRRSGYWYPFREVPASGHLDDFFPGTRSSDVVVLYDFDAHLRAATDPDIEGHEAHATPHPSISCHHRYRPPHLAVDRL